MVGASDIVRTALRGTSVEILAVGCGAGLEGSGWVPRTGEVVTNAHVVGGSKAVEVRLPDGSGPYHVTALVLFDPNDDIAVLKVPGLPQQPLPLYPKPGFAPATVPARVFWAGYPKAGPYTLTAGLLYSEQSSHQLNIYGKPQPTTDVLLRGEVQPGNSGSPIVDSHGQLVAMVSQGQRGNVPATERFDYGVPLKDIRADLTKVQAGGKPVGATRCSSEAPRD